MFLVTVADVQGLSYYADASIARHLNLDQVALATARQQIIQADLLAYCKPLYQVFSLTEDSPARQASSTAAPRCEKARSVGEILRRALKGGSV